jgi:GT2 family glycosyltransferase
MPAKSRAKACVVIPNWNGREMIGNCLGSLLSQSMPCDIVVVDNGSRDGSADFIEANFPDVRVIRKRKNLGFAGGMNAGLRYGLSKGYRFIAALNNDAVVDRNWLKHLKEALDKNAGCGSATGLMLTADKKRVDNTGDFYSVWGQTIPRQRGVPAAQAAKTSEPVFGAAAGSCLYRSKMLDQVGLYDDLFFAYFEDTDLNFRAQLSGWQAVYEPRAITYHAINATSSKMGNFTAYHTLKNYFFLYFKNMPGRLFWKYLPRFCFGFCYVTLAKLRKLRFGVVLKAYLVILLSIPLLIVRRRRIQKSKRASVDYIDSILLKSFPFRSAGRK